MALASREDIEASLLRGLTPSESKYFQTLADRVENMIRVRVPAEKWEKFAQTNHSYLVQVEAEAVARVFRNPEGKIQEADGQYSYQVSSLVGSGLLQVLPSEWDLLGLGDGDWESVPIRSDDYARRRFHGLGPWDWFGWNVPRGSQSVIPPGWGS